MAKFRMKEVEAALATIHQAIADFRSDAAAEKAAQADDNEQPTGGTKAPAAATNSGSAQDRAINAFAQGQFVAATKGLTYIPDTAASRALEAAIPALGRLRGRY